MTIVIGHLVFEGKQANRAKNYLDHMRGLERRIRSAERRQLPYLGLLQSEYAEVLINYHHFLETTQTMKDTEYFLANPGAASNLLPEETDPGGRPDYSCSMPDAR